GTFSVGYSVNNRGQVVGQSRNKAGATVAYLWENGVMKSIANFGNGFTRASAINNKGEIVGLGVLSDGRVAGFKTNASGGPVQRVTALTGNYTTLFAINEQGQFVGDADSGAHDPQGRDGFDA